MKPNIRIPSTRGPNMVEADPQRMESADGSRWACGRNVKVSTGYRTFGIVQVWTTKRRENGKVVVVDSGIGRDEAKAWVFAE